MIKNRLTSVRSPRKAIYQFFAFLLLMLFLFYPFDFTISPERIFKLVDENKKPIPRANIKQVWYQYSLHYSHEESIEPGTDGIVVLPRRTIRTRWIDLMTGAVGKIIEYKINASIGSSDSIFIDAIGYETKWFFDGEGLGNTVVLKRQ